MVNEIRLLAEMRGEVPEGLDVTGAERRLAEMVAERGPATARIRRRRVVSRLLLAGACVLAVAVFLPFMRPSGLPGTATPTAPLTTDGAANVLEQAALVASRTGANEIRPDQWLYLKESQHMGGGDLPVFEHWGRMDGKRSALREEGGALRETAAEKGPTHVGRTQKEVDSLPTDPDVLLAHLRALKTERVVLSICRPRCSPEISGDVRAFGAIGWYMKFGPLIPPDTVAGMYRALAKLPQVSIEQNTKDADGRPGIGVAFDAGEGTKAYYILDRRDYRFMGMKVVSADGTVVGMSVLAAGIVNHPGDLP
ncbi:CU044_5270 family protein [Nonomuraea sp. NPDC050790]|uniref:CU044_5270 family protein n=1 Tax=Nonomuraea sp. NPDC050790 TaxID=3364371 RepID=UPI0037A271B2